MLVRKLRLDPDTFDAVRAQARLILDDESPEGAPARLALAEALRSGGPAAVLKTLARPAVRAVLRDASLYGTRLTRAEFRGLVTFADDAALRVDSPALPVVPREPLGTWVQPFHGEIKAADTGSVPVLDCAFLPNGQLLLALGEVGASLRSRDGRSLARFDVPAHRLVVSDAGDRAIALGSRGKSWRLSKLDLVRRTAQDWCDAQIDAFAPDYDGQLWFVATESLFAIDTTRSRFDGPWSVPDVVARGGDTLRLARSATGFSVLVPSPGGEEVWHYALPGLILRSRREMPGVTRYADTRAVVTQSALSAAGLVARQHLGLTPEHTTGPPSLLWSRDGQRWSERRIGEAGEGPASLVASETWIAAGVREPRAVRVLLLDAKEGNVRTQIRLEGAERVCLRLSGETLSLADDRGRVLVLDLDQGWLLRDLRI
jgi:hypothetical protein